MPETRKNKAQEGGEKCICFFIRDNLLRDVIFLCFFFVHNIFFSSQKQLFHILPPILTDFLSHVPPKKLKYCREKKIIFGNEIPNWMEMYLILRVMRHEVCCSVIYGFFTINYKKAFYSLLISILHIAIIPCNKIQTYSLTRIFFQFLLLFLLQFFFLFFRIFFLRL